MTTERRTGAQHTPATPDGRTNRRDGRQPARHMQQMPGEWGLAFAARGVKHEQKPHDFLLQPPGRGPRFPDPATNLQQEKGRHHTRTRPPTSPSSPANRIHKGPGKGPGQTHGTRGWAINHKNVNKPPARVLPSRPSIRGYVHRGDRRAPPPGKLNAWDAQGYGTYNLCEWYGGHTPRRQLTTSIRGRGAGTLPGTPVLQNPTRGMRGATSSPHGAAPAPCQQARVCYAEPNPPHRTERPDTTAQAEAP